jgi:hypothetical protein
VAWGDLVTANGSLPALLLWMLTTRGLLHVVVCMWLGLKHHRSCGSWPGRGKWTTLTVLLAFKHLLATM